MNLQKARYTRARRRPRPPPDPGRRGPRPAPAPIVYTGPGSVEADAAAGSTAIRPFRIAIPGAALADLRRRIAATQWPDRETVADHSQGVPRAEVSRRAAGEPPRSPSVSARHRPAEPEDARRTAPREGGGPSIFIHRSAAGITCRVRLSSGAALSQRCSPTAPPQPARTAPATVRRRCAGHARSSI
jgi:hypothetical protein